MLKPFAVTTLAAAALAASAVTAAAPQAGDPRHCSRQAPGSCLDGVGGVTLPNHLWVAAGGRRAGAIAGEERHQRRAESGVSAGGGDAGGRTAWGGDRYEREVRIARDGAHSSYTFLVGADRGFPKRFLAGFTLGHEATDVDPFDNGGGQGRDGLNVAVYGAYLINDVFSLDASAGYGALDSDDPRMDPVGTSLLSGTYDTHRAFFSANINAIKAYGRWVVGARLGALHAVESHDAFRAVGGPSARAARDRYVDLTQAYGSVDVGYSAGAFKPYMVLEYRNDLGRDDSLGAGGPGGGVRTQPGHDEWQGGLGVRYFGQGGITGNLQWLRTEGRDDLDGDSVNLTIRVPF